MICTRRRCPSDTCRRWHTFAGHHTRRTTTSHALLNPDTRGASLSRSYRVQAPVEVHVQHAHKLVPSLGVLGLLALHDVTCSYVGLAQLPVHTADAWHTRVGGDNHHTRTTAAAAPRTHPKPENATVRVPQSVPRNARFRFSVES